LRFTSFFSRIRPARSPRHQPLLVATSAEL
jgi:hypothetical protein